MLCWRKGAICVADRRRQRIVCSNVGRVKHLYYALLTLCIDLEALSAALKNNRKWARCLLLSVANDSSQVGNVED